MICKFLIRNWYCLFLLALHFLTICRCDDNNVHSLKGKLKFAHILFRHGDRTPLKPYPNDPYNDLKYWPTGWGQLTNIGKMQHYMLGKWLQKRYKHLVNDTCFTNDIVYVRSTDVDRTLMSAESNLAGLFPPISNQMWNSQIDWQPIPVHTIPENLDELLAAKKPCPAYDYAESQLKKTEMFQNLDKKYNKLYEYLSENTGRKIQSLVDVEYIYSILNIETLYNLTLPEWTKSVFPGGDMEWISNFSFSLMTYTREMARLKTGPLLKEILQRFDDKFNSKLDPDRSLWIYSGHDITVANLLNTLKLFEPHSPQYTSCILLELRIYKNEPFISIFYKKSINDNNPPPLIIPNCGRSCPLTKIYDLYKDVLPENWNSECKLSLLQMTYEDANVEYTAGILVIFTSAALFLIFLYYICLKRKSYFDYNLYMNSDE